MVAQVLDLVWSILTCKYFRNSQDTNDENNEGQSAVEKTNFFLDIRISQLKEFYDRCYQEDLDVHLEAGTNHFKQEGNNKEMMKSLMKKIHHRVERIQEAVDAHLATLLRYNWSQHDKKEYDQKKTKFDDAQLISNS